MQKSKNGYGMAPLRPCPLKQQNNVEKYGFKILRSTNYFEQIKAIYAYVALANLESIKHSESCLMVLYYKYS